jgi:IS30 family transposase
MLAALRTQGYSASRIARELGRHPSSISREIRRNRCNDDAYRPSKADRRTRGRRVRSRRNQRFGPRDLRLVESLLPHLWSPEQIAGYLKRHGLLSISHETIYQHIWRDKQRGGQLYEYLRCAGKLRRKRYGRYDSRGRLAGKRHISERPASVEERREPDHWEIDTVMGTGSKDCIVTLVERKTGYTVIGKLPDRSMVELTARATWLIRKHPGRFQTITADNGTEFHDYERIEAQTGVCFYFANPHHSWERGTNENTNGLIRQYLPKGMNMGAVTQQDCSLIADSLNHRPRKRLGFRTPKECFNES